MDGLAPAKWPLQDKLMWKALLQSNSLLDDNGGLAHLRKTSVRVLEQAYRHWLGWLIAQEPEALQTPPVERATLACLVRWLDALANLSPMTRLFYVEGVLRVLRAAAPDADWSQQRRLLLKLKRLAGHGDPQRKQGRVLSSSVLLAAGIAYAETHPKASPTDIERAARACTGTMIAMLSLMPLRCLTFRTLKLGQSVQVDASRILICVPGESMKSGNSWEAEVPEVIEPLLRRYIDEVRPWIMRRSNEKHDFLWVTERGTPFLNGYIGVRIALATKEATGVRVSPHLFRDAAATTLARASPQSARLIKPLLAHTSFETAERHYIHASSIEVGRDYAALIRDLRKKA